MITLLAFIALAAFAGLFVIGVEAHRQQATRRRHLIRNNKEGGR